MSEIPASWHPFCGVWPQRHHYWCEWVQLTSHWSSGPSRSSSHSFFSLLKGNTLKRGMWQRGKCLSFIRSPRQNPLIWILFLIIYFQPFLSCVLYKFLEGNAYPMELELSLIPFKGWMLHRWFVLFFSSHACRWETLCSTVLSNRRFISLPSKAAHTFSSLFLWGSKEKTGKDKAFWGPSPGAEDKIQCPKWASCKKETRARKKRSNKQRAGENKLVCNRSLTRLLAGYDERHIKQRDWKAKWEAKMSTLCAVSWDMPQCLPGATQRRGARTSAVKASTHTHGKATITTMSTLKRHPNQFFLVLKMASKPLWKEIAHMWHTEIHWLVYVPCLRGPLIQWTCATGVTVELRE